MDYPEIKKIEETELILSFVVDVKETDGSIKPFMLGIDDSGMTATYYLYRMNDLNQPKNLHHCSNPNEYQIRRYMNPDDMGKYVRVNGKILWETAKMVKFSVTTTIETTMEVVE